jgi:hypothetical protein
VLGVPGSPGAIGVAAIALGLIAAIVALVLLRRWIHAEGLAGGAALVALVLAGAAIPYVVYRIGEDMRATTRLDAYSVAASGPIQAYLPGYLVEPVRRFVPRGATYATVVGSNVPYAPARAAFGSLALQTLFPRRSVADPSRADYVVSWGVEPSRIVHVRRQWVARKAFAQNPTLYVGQVAR